MHTPYHAFGLSYTYEVSTYKYANDPELMITKKDENNNYCDCTQNANYIYTQDTNRAEAPVHTYRYIYMICEGQTEGEEERGRR
jgi:hypothetical protein